MATAEVRSTYIKKVCDGAYEYGWSFPNRNFRKQQVFERVGVEVSIVEAEAARELLASKAACI